MRQDQGTKAHFVYSKSKSQELTNKILPPPCLFPRTTSTLRTHDNLSPKASPNSSEAAASCRRGCIPAWKELAPKDGAVWGGDDFLPLHPDFWAKQSVPKTFSRYPQGAHHCSAQAGTGASLGSGCCVCICYERLWF